MTICTIVLTVVSCTVDPSTKLSPADAAKLLAPHQFVYVEPATGPTVTYIPYTPPNAYPIPPTYPLTADYFNLRAYTGRLTYGHVRLTHRGRR
jgi:hypothetical protein